MTYQAVDVQGTVLNVGDEVWKAQHWRNSSAKLVKKTITKIENNLVYMDKFYSNCPEIQLLKV